MNEKSRSDDKGFSLIELIIAIAILVILTGLLAPNLMRYIERSRESVCIKNRDEIVNIYKVEHVSDELYTLVSAIRQYQDNCPSEGIYIAASLELLHPKVGCSIHDSEELGDISDIVISEKMYEQMIQFAGKSKSEIEAFLKKHLGDTNKNPSNDNIRKYLYEKINGGTWPELDKRISGPDKTLYVQPYINNHVKDLGDTNHRDVIVFASSTNAQSTSWNVSHIYNPDDQKWYTGKSFSIADKDWDTVWGEMQAGGWNEVKKEVN